MKFYYYLQYYFGSSIRISLNAYSHLNFQSTDFITILYYKFLNVKFYFIFYFLSSIF